jgi:hypothetical protein
MPGVMTALMPLVRGFTPARTAGRTGLRGLEIRGSGQRQFFVQIEPFDSIAGLHRSPGEIGPQQYGQFETGKLEGV